jgi:hypothetical protein
MNGVNDPGTYAVTSGEKTTAVEADGYDYGGESGNLRLHKAGRTVAEFRWWDSVVRKGD